MRLTLIILSLAALIDTSSQSGCYGNINRVDTIGASCQTARPERLPYCGGISAYNKGPRNVWTYARLDIGTTHNDYANDVIARAKFYKRNGY